MSIKQITTWYKFIHPTSIRYELVLHDPSQILAQKRILQLTKKHTATTTRSFNILLNPEVEALLNLSVSQEES